MLQRRYGYVVPTHGAGLVIVPLGHYGLKVGNVIKQGEVRVFDIFKGSAHRLINIEVAALEYAVRLAELAVNDQRPLLQLIQSGGYELGIQLRKHAGKQVNVWNQPRAFLEKVYQ